MVNSDAYSFDPDTKKLTLRGVTAFPLDILTFADKIEILDMSVGHMNSLPDDFSKLTNLKVLFLSNHDFTELPPILARCEKLEMVGMKSCKIERLDGEHLPASLRALTLTDNQIKEVTPGVGRLKNLQKLILTGNQISDLPRELLECSKLELIRLAVNCFETLPEWLLQLPKLAWYGDAGNPASKRGVRSAETIDWSQLTIGKELGRSAKNIVYGAMLGGNEVAVKLYGGEISADGNTEDEMQINLLVGKHDHLIECIGEVKNAPDGKRGLVMGLVPSEFKTLAGPPNFSTQTRDIYSGMYENAFVKNVLHDIASALGHLHERGIMHGDIYSHNMLVDSAGRSYIGDYGASTFYDPRFSKVREYVEVRAFAYLMEELLEHCQNPAHNLVEIKEQLLASPRSYSFAKISAMLVD